MLRDTDEDWKGIAGEPFYGVFSNTDYFRENMTPERLEEFWESGRVEVDGLLARVRQFYGPFEPKTAIDFGCGVGRLTRAISRHVEHATGIDVAPLMLAEARRHAPANVVYSDTFPDGAVDWINSIIVFQHIHPTNGFPLLQKLIGCLKPGGGLTLQVTLYKERKALPLALEGIDCAFWDGDQIRPVLETPVGSGAMMMYDYDLNRIMALFHAANINRVSLEHTDHAGCHGVFIIGRKD